MSVLSLLNRVLARGGYSVIKNDALEVLLQHESDLACIASVSDLARHKIVNALPKSKAQLKQDVFALAQSDFKENGFFVEFGATDGISLSNTYMLEQDFNWRGILSEPGRCWHAALYENRSCTIDESCIWSASSGPILFNEISASPELSAIGSYIKTDNGNSSDHQYLVETLSLNDLLAKHDAPCRIDYLSIDTEGSEFEIIAALDFDRYDVRTITIEHNYAASRQIIFDLLTNKGFRRTLVGLSRWDDWYVKER